MVDAWLRDGLEESVRKLLNQPPGGQRTVVFSSVDKLGFDKFMLGDVDRNFQLLSAWVSAGAGMPRTSTLAQYLMSLDTNGQLSGGGSTRERVLWGKCEADKIHMLLSYVSRLLRRAPLGSRSIKLLQLKQMSASVVVSCPALLDLDAPRSPPPPVVPDYPMDSDSELASESEHAGDQLPPPLPPLP